MFILSSSVCKSLQYLTSTLTQGGKVVIYLGSLVQLCFGGEEHCKQISLVCVGSASSVWVTLDLPPLMACVLSWLLRLQVALQGNCLRQALGCVHFPDLCRSGSQVLHKGVDSGGPVFCALPRSEQLRPPDAWRVHSPKGWCVLSPSCF